MLKAAPDQRPVFDGEGKGRIELKSQQGWQKPIGWIIVEGFEIRNGFKADNQRSNLEHGIYCTGTDFTIVNNVIHSNKAYGIQVAGYPYHPENHPGPEFADARGWLISNNTLALNQNRAGIVIWQSRATDCVIQNNIFYKNSVSLRTEAVQGIHFVSAGGGHVIRNNLFYAPGRQSIGEAGTFSATDNIEQQDPRFVEPEQFDFRLQPRSPAIDAGVPESAHATDGTRRCKPTTSAEENMPKPLQINTLRSSQLRAISGTNPSTNSRELAYCQRSPQSPPPRFQVRSPQVLDTTPVNCSTPH